MRTKLIAIMAAVCFTATCFAKDIKIVVLNTDPQMHCANCESKIKNNIRFEKGIKEIETNLADKTVTIKYDADKTTVEKIIAGRFIIQLLLLKMRVSRRMISVANSRKQMRMVVNKKEENR